MSTKVLTTNVFLTTSKKISDKVFKNGTGFFSERLKNLTEMEKELSVIASPERNDKLLEFDFNVDFSKGKDQGSYYLSFKILETDSLFEKYFLYSVNVDNRLLIDNAQSLQDSSSINPSAGVNFYCAFGTGDDLNAWAGPFKCHFFNANFTLTQDGTKVITVECNPIADTFLLRNVYNEYHNDLRLLDVHVDIVGEEKIVQSDIFSKSKINKAYSESIKKYIKSFLNQQYEVIVLLPDIHEVITEVLQNDLANKNYNRLFQQLGIECYSNINPSKSILNIPDLQHDGKKADLSKTPLLGNLSLIVKGIHTTNTNTLIPNPLLKLNKIMTSLTEVFSRKQLKTKKFTGHFCIETNLRIIELMKKYGMIEKATNVFIFGDLDLINELLYLTKTNNSGEIGKIDVLNNVSITKETRQKFVNSKYRKEFFETQNRLLELTFGTYGMKADKLAIQNNANTKKYIPFFRYNVTNPNVVSMNLEVIPSYFIMLKTGLGYAFEGAAVNNKNLESSEEKIKKAMREAKFDEMKKEFNKLVDSASGSTPELNNVKNILDSFSNDVELASNKVNKFNNSIFKKVLDPNTVSKIYARHVTLKYKNYEKDLNKAFTQVRSKAEVLIIQNEILKRLRFSVKNLTIRTPPLLGCTFLYPTRCVVDAETNSIIGSKITPKEKSFLSGEWSIIGYRHVITGETSYSEFVLLRTNPELYPEIDAENMRIKSAQELIKYNTN